MMQTYRAAHPHALGGVEGFRMRFNPKTSLWQKLVLRDTEATSLGQMAVSGNNTWLDVPLTDGG
jgi:hypothetical protein